MQKFLDTIHDLEEKSNYFEQKVRKKPGSLYTFESIIGSSNAIMTLKKKGKIFARGNEPILSSEKAGQGRSWWHGPAFSQFAGRQAFCDRQLRGVAP